MELGNELGTAVVNDGNSANADVSIPVVENNTTGPVINTEDGVTMNDFRSIAPSLRKLDKGQNNPDSVAAGQKTVEGQKPDTKPEGSVKTEDVTPPGTVEDTKPEDIINKVKLPTGEELTIDEILELKKGNMLNADYTRKTQELANERKKIQEDADFIKKVKGLPVDDALDLWNQLSIDPIGTLRYLEEKYTEQGITEPKDPEIVKAEKALAKKEEENKKLTEDLDASKVEENRRLFKQYMDGLADKYKDEGFDSEKVLAYCMEKNIPDPEIAFKAMVHDDTTATLRGKIKELEDQSKEQKDKVITEYIKEKATSVATHTTPVGAGPSGSGVSVEVPKTWKASRQAAMARLGAKI